jgi:hypothetical protein
VEKVFAQKAEAFFYWYIEYIIYGVLYYDEEERSIGSAALIIGYQPSGKDAESR